MATSSIPRTKTICLTPAKENELLSKINEDVINFMKKFLYEHGQIFGSRVYDEMRQIMTPERRAIVCAKIMRGLFETAITPIVGGVLFLNFIYLLKKKSSPPRRGVIAVKKRKEQAQFKTINDDNPNPVAFPEPEIPFRDDCDRRRAEEEHYKQEQERIKKEKKQKEIDEKNKKKAENILDMILNARHEGRDNLYMNFVLVLYVKANRKSTSGSVGAVKMFRFAKKNEHDKPSDNFFIGGDLRLYKNWADFVDNNQIPHNCLILAPSAGQFLYTDGILHLDLFHVTRYIKTYVEPVLAGAGLVGTGMLCSSLPPVGLAVGIGASGVSAVSGITRGLIELFDRRAHSTLMRPSSIIPTIDILSNMIFVHSAMGALKLSKIGNAEKLLSCFLFTENAFRIGVVTRLSLDILSTIIAFACGKLDLASMSQRLLSNCIFFYNVGLSFDLAAYASNISTLACAVPTCLTYECIQPFFQMAQNYIADLPGFPLVENLPEFTGLFSFVIDHLQKNHCSFAILTTTLQRLMNVKWKLIVDELKRCKDCVDEFFSEDKHLSNFKNIQMAIVHSLNEKLKKYVKVDDQNINEVEFYIKKCMKNVINQWIRMCGEVHSDQKPEIHASMVMQYLLDKIDLVLRYNVVSDKKSNPSNLQASSSSAPSEVRSPGNEKLSMKVVFALIKNQLIRDENYNELMSFECKEMIARKELKPIRHVLQHGNVSVSFIQLQSTNVASEEIYEENPSAFYKVDPHTKLAVLIKYELN